MSRFFGGGVSVFIACQIQFNYRRASRICGEGQSSQGNVVTCVLLLGDEHRPRRLKE